MHFRVISVEPLSMRIEVTLRTSNTPKASNKGIADSSSLSVGDIISGYIRGVASFGLFISIDQTNCVRNCAFLIEQLLDLFLTP